MAEQVVMYKCKETGKLFDSAKKADNSAKAERERRKKALEAESIRIQALANQKALRNYIRNNCASIADLPSMITTFCQDNFNLTLIGLNIRVTFSPRCSNSHSQPIDGVSNWCGTHKDKPTSYPGFNGTIEIAEAIIDKKLLKSMSNSVHSDPGICEFIFGRWSGENDGLISGFTTGSGCGGRLNDPTCKTRIGITFFLQDFPLLEAMYPQWLEASRIYRENNLAESAVKREGSQFVHTHPDVMDLVRRIDTLNGQLAELRAALYNEFIAANVPSLQKLPDNHLNLVDVFGQLTGGSY